MWIRLCVLEWTVSALVVMCLFVFLKWYWTCYKCEIVTTSGICDFSLVLRKYRVFFTTLDELIRLCQSCTLVNWLALHRALCPVNLKVLVNNLCCCEACPNMGWKDLSWKPSNAHKPPSDIRTWNKHVLMRLLEIPGTIMRDWSRQEAYGCLVLIELSSVFLLAFWCEIAFSTSGLC